MVIFSVSGLGQFAKEPEAPQEGTSFTAGVTLRRIDWANRDFDTHIEIHLEAFPYDITTEVPHSKVWNSIESTALSMYDKAMIPLFALTQTAPYRFSGNVTTDFQLAGPTGLYPFDRYMLNITFGLPFRPQVENTSTRSLINETNTWIWLRCQEGGFDWAVEPVPPRAQYGSHEPRFLKITYTFSEQDGLEWVNLNYKVVLFRQYSSTNLIMVVLSICYALVGSLPLIRPDRLEHRLSVCLSLFIFAVTFTFTIPAPTPTGATLAGTLILILLTGAGMFSVVSIAEKALIEVRQGLSACQYLAEGAVILILINQLNQSLIYLVPSQEVAAFPWAPFPSGLSASLSIILLYGYVVVTFVFVLNLVRTTRSRISKRL